MSDARTQVRLFVEQHQQDGLLYTACPTCGKHNKLMIGPADEGGHWYKCLSAGCATFGTTDRVGTPAAAEKPSAARTTYDPYRERKDYAGLTDSASRLLGRRYSLHEDFVGILCTGRVMHSWVFPVYDMYGRERGYVERASVQKDGPKTLLRPYMSSGEVPMVSWYFPKFHREDVPVCIVEDQPSAARLAQYFPTVALLGTSLPQRALDEVRELTPTRICVILDNDAQAAAANLANSIGGIAIPMFHEDVKDMDNENFDMLCEVTRGG